TVHVKKAAAAPIAAAAVALVAMAFTVIFMVRSPPRLAPRCSHVATLVVTGVSCAGAVTLPRTPVQYA
ncbi:MAG: hypothetical protein WBR28_33535, partial [Mycobacterium sp.]